MLKKAILRVLVVVMLMGLYVYVGWAQVQPFFAPPQYSGSIQVKLVPTEAVSPGTATLVTFGFPFPRGSVTVAGLSKVRILKNGSEISAYVNQLTPWRHIYNTNIDGQSVRVARIQISYTFSSTNPENITVEWGLNDRTKNISSLTSVRNGWHKVTSGTFRNPPSGHSVYEPNIYAVLPKAYMCLGLLREPMKPMDNVVGEVQDSGEDMQNYNFTGYQKYDFMSKNLFYTYAQNNFANMYTATEPWLYDRSASMFVLYFRSGFFTALREAVRNGVFYSTYIEDGRWTPLVDDDKYQYPECLAYIHWITGDDEIVSQIVDMANSMTTRTAYTTSGGFTERHPAYKLLGNLLAYEVSGNTTVKNKAKTIIQDFLNWQNGAGGVIPTPRIDGGLWHKGNQHDSYCEEITNGPCEQFLASPWMSVLLTDAMVRAYSQTEDANVANFLKRFGNFLKESSTWTGGYRYASYLFGINGVIVNRQNDNMEHAVETCALAAWSYYFSKLTGTPDASLEQLATNLYDTFEYRVDTQLPDYDVSPPRKYGWQYRTSGGFSWALSAGNNSDVTQPTVALTAPSNGATVSGAITISATASDNVGVFAVQFLLDGNAIGSEDGNSPYSISLNTTTLSNGNHTLTARARDAAGNMKISAGVTITVTGGSNCPVSTASNIINQTFLAQIATFTVSADVTPKAVGGVLGDTGVGINQSPPLNETGPFQTAATVRFNTANNKIEARNGADYPAGTISWTAGQAYRVRLVANVTTHKYDAYVKALPSGTEQAIGTGLSFRSNYGSVTFLNNFRAPVDDGSLEVCNLVLPTCATSTASAIFNQKFTTQTGTFTVSVDATPTAVSGTLGDTGIGVNQDPPVGESGSFQTATTVRFNTANNHIEARNGSAYIATTISWTAGQSYRIRLVINVATHKYDAYVKVLPSGTEQTIGTGLSFRSNYSNATSLNNFRAPVDSGSIQVCNMLLP